MYWRNSHPQRGGNWGICPGLRSARPTKDRYTLIEQSTTLLKQSIHHGEGIIIHSLHDIDYYSCEIYTWCVNCEQES